MFILLFLFLSILYITITSLNEAAHVYMTNELATFFDILYPQIEQISKVKIFYSLIRNHFLNSLNFT